VEVNHIHSAPDWLIQAFYQLPDKDLRQQGICIAEGKTVTDRLLESTLEILGVLCTKDHIEYYEKRSMGRWPVYSGTRREIGELLGFKFHRGVLAAARRPEIGRGFLDPKTYIPPPGSWGLSLISVQEESNVGTLIRSAKAFGADFVALGPFTGDGFSRKAIRASVGYSLSTTFLLVDSDTAFLDWASNNRVLLGIADGDPKESIASHHVGRHIHKLLQIDRWDSVCLMLGHEFAGHGPEVAQNIEELGGIRIRIPMALGVDSLNVAAAGAILMHEMYSLFSQA
jgi:tRNA G18 (ribose-2'-O)-methylase SpoU